MIKVTINRNAEGQISGFVVKGHANFAPKGTDVVCASISAIAQTAVLGIVDVAKAEVEIEKIDGFLSVKLREGHKRLDIRTIFDTMIAGIVSVADQFPDYVKIIEEKKL